MSKTYQIQMFGKSGCDKCHVLGQRLDKILSDKQWADFEKVYFDVETEDGLIAFSEAECINPQRIPALLVTRRIEKTNDYAPVPRRLDEAGPVPVTKSRLNAFIGLQTDYSEEGRGVISPNMITTVLTEAAAAHG